MHETTLSGARRFASSGQRRRGHGGGDQRAHAAVGDDRRAGAQALLEAARHPEPGSEARGRSTPFEGRVNSGRVIPAGRAARRILRTSSERTDVAGAAQRADRLPSRLEATRRAPGGGSLLRSRRGPWRRGPSPALFTAGRASRLVASLPIRTTALRVRGLTAIILRLGGFGGGLRPAVSVFFSSSWTTRPSMPPATVIDLAGDVAGELVGGEHDDLPRDVLGLRDLAQRHRPRDAPDRPGRRGRASSATRSSPGRRRSRARAARRGRPRSSG